MDGSNWLWVVLGVIVIALLIVAAVVGTRKKQTMRINKADTMRDEAAEDAALLAQRENKAAEVDAHARAARAEADAKAAEAERLSATAQRQQADAADDRSELDERLRRADEVDPRVSDGEAKTETGQPGAGDTRTDTPAVSGNETHQPRS